MKSIIQKVSALALMAFAVLNANAQRPAVTLSPVNIAPGEEQTVSIFVADTPADSLRGFMADVTLPENFTFVKQGNAYAVKGERTSASQFRLISPSVTTTGDVQTCRMVVQNMVDKTPFTTDTDKPVLTFTIKAPESFAAISNISVVNISMSGQHSYNGKSTGSPYTASGTITNSTAPQLTFGFAGADTLALNLGDTATITINATWPAEFNVKAANGTIVLPEGLSFVNTDSPLTFTDSRFGNALVKNQKVNGNTLTWALADYSVLAENPEEFGTFAVKVDDSFTSFRIISANYTFAGENEEAVGTGEVNLAVRVIAAAPTFAVAPDTLKLNEGETGNIAIAVNVPEGTKPTVKGAVTLPEGLTFVEGDGTFNLEALEANDTVKVAIKAGKAFEGAKEVAVAINATSEAGDVYDTFNGVVAVSIAAPEAPTFAFAETDSLALEENTEATIAVNLTIPEGTELSNVTGTVTLPTGVSFSTQTAGIIIDGNDVNFNGNTATWTAAPTESGVLLTLNIHTNQAFKDGVVKVEATATSKEGTTFDTVTIERAIGNKTAAGINSISVDEVKNYNGPIYNMAGQRVSKSYKGIVIINGKKIINK